MGENRISMVASMVEGSPIGFIVEPAAYPPSMRVALEDLCRSGLPTGTKALAPHHRLANRWVVVPAPVTGDRT